MESEAVSRLDSEMIGDDLILFMSTANRHGFWLSLLGESVHSLVTHA